MSIRALALATRWRPTVDTILDLTLVADRSAVDVFPALEAFCVYHVLKCCEPKLKQMLFLT